MCYPLEDSTHWDLISSLSGISEGKLSRYFIMKYAGYFQNSSSLLMNNERYSLSQDELLLLNQKKLSIMENEWYRISFKKDSHSFYKAVGALQASGMMNLDEFVTKDKFKQIISSNDFATLFKIYHHIGESAHMGGNEELMSHFIETLRYLSAQDQITLFNEISGNADGRKRKSVN